MTKRRQTEAIIYSTVGVGVMLIILVAFNIIASVAKQRIDLTAEKLYTLSPGTKAILKKLDTPVKIRFYCTQGDNAMPVVFKNYASRVEDLLAEYKQVAKGKIEIEKYDPQPDSDAEDSASLDGVEGQMVNLNEKIYLGLAISCLDAKVTLPFLSPDREKLLEYDISRAISRTTVTEKPTVGIMSSLPIFGQPMNPMMQQMGQRGQEPWVLLNELKSDFNVKQVDLSVDEIPSDVKVLVVVHPKGISPKAQFAIDQFLLRGGKLLAFLDPHSLMDKPNVPGMNPLQAAQQQTGSTLDLLLKAWGVDYDMTKVVADMTFMTQMRTQQGVQSYPSVLSVKKEGVNPDDVITSEIDNMLLLFAGTFSGTPVQGLKKTALLHTTSKSQQVEGFMAEYSGAQTVKDFNSSGKEQDLAIRLTGKFKTAFPNGKPADTAAAPEDTNSVSKASLKEGTTETTVVLVGDSDMIADQFCAASQNIFGQKIVQLINGNLPFAQSLVEQMSGDSNLIGVRSRATMNRPFTVVKKMQAQAEEDYRAKIKQLEQELSTTQQRLNELQKTKETGQRFVMSPEQQKEVANFRKKEGEVKKQLKNMRKELKRDIDSLENRLKWANIAGMPVAVTMAGIALAIFKRKKTAAK